MDPSPFPRPRPTLRARAPAAATAGRAPRLLGGRRGRSAPVTAALFVAAAATLAVTGCSAGASRGLAEATGAADSSPIGSFVRTKGTHFELDGKLFYFQGTNAARFATGERESEAQVYAAMKQYAALGIRVVRFWGFSCRGQFSGEPMIESAAGGSITYNEDALRRLDATLDAARAAGLKVILPVVNFEPAYCGMSFWSQDVIGSADKQTFYSDDRVKKAFKKHVATILGRVNTAYKATIGRTVRYADDPTIMAIEIANEPHTEDSYEQRRGQRPGDLVNGFLGDMSRYIRTLDTNHLISSGEEGYRTTVDPVRDGDQHTWINDGLKGVDFDRDVALPDIDFATVHLYPDNWEIASSEIEWVQTQFVRRRADIAHAAGKPIVMEESGFSNDPTWRGAHLGYVSAPATWLQKVYGFANDEDYAGTMIWQLMTPGFGAVGYDYTIGDPVSAVVQAQAQVMRGLSGGPPLASAR